ncbi:probable phosphoglycerate mutase [Modestobacter sp. DSM 44400]|uniref:histidine phosphatase family protein n=1 Tax=Modestobacter sp. DSM 44400 TaxID=1550230 RepID=UPI000897D1FA|nr:histidine phosphatase family protein [Modestobacter sp. DSM 44400]SDY07923.1 probable phosphoglycerate mutase [Modestobacter sp. DSM 44400]
MTDGVAVPPVARLLVWRHGRTEWNAGGRFQGQLDPPLDDEGRAQAARTAPHLAELLSGQQTAVISSDLLRARGTAAALAPLLGVPVQVDERLREHGLGAWEGLTRDEVAERHPEQYADWMSGRPVRGRGGESADSVGQRSLAAVAGLPPVDVAVLVTHGGTAGRLVEVLMGLGADHRRVFGPLGNCHWSELTFQSTRWRLMQHNVSVPRPGRAPTPVDVTLAGRRSGADADGHPSRSGATPEEGAPAASPEDADAAL